MLNLFVGHPIDTHTLMGLPLILFFILLNYTYFYSFLFDIVVVVYIIVLHIK